MRKIIPFVVIGILVLSGLGASAINVAKENTNIETTEKIINENTRSTHTVFGEYGTSTTCGYCKYAHGALKELYAEGQLDFYYVSLVCNQNSIAYARAQNDYNLYGYPTVWWDGGYEVDIGAGSIPGAKATYTTSINNCGARTVKNVNIILDATWLGGTNMQIDCTVYNNEATTYDGTIRVYITDISSSEGWTDTYGKLYTFAFLDWAFNEVISIPSGGSWTDSMTWDGSSHGYSSITEDNTMIIAAVFNDEWHQGYSYTPPQNPFDAYYVDDSVGFRVGNNRPPNTPSSPNPSNGATNVNLNPTLSWVGGDPDWFDDLYYDVYFEKDDPTPDVKVSEDQTGTTYTPGTLDLDSTYYWKIVAEDEHGASTTGPTWSFTTRGNDPPYMPYNPNPDDGETDVSINTLLSWSGGDPDGDTTYYDVYFDPEDPNPTTLVSEDQTGKTYDPGELDSETTYYWKIIAEDIFGEITEGPIWSFTTRAPQPDLDCIGSLQWGDVGAGTTVTGNFTVKNIGDPTSELYWEISEFPEWGTDWTFTPDHGDALTPEEGEFTVEVSVVAPPDKNKLFTGVIKVINTNDPSDHDSIPVTLKTPRSKPVFINIFEKILNTFPNAFPMLRLLLGL
jgi:hypothetical protein